jgi:hypothetical protein
MQIAQYGTVVSLPASTGGRTTKHALALYEATGAMKNFNLGSSALIQQSLLDDLGGAATSIIDAKAKRDEAKKAQADELTQLERKRKLLEEMLKIKEAEETLKKQSP